jgi:uncharacterized DUF497 family protein
VTRCRRSQSSACKRPGEGEFRWITVGMNAGAEILVVLWTERDYGERLISVR